jgi:hypothetical protein
LKIEIGGVGTEAFMLPHVIDRVELKALAGGLRVDDLDFENLSSR